MKRAKATKTEKKMINDWFNFYDFQKLSSCPFIKLIAKSECNQSTSYCRKFFPTLAIQACPCHQFSLKYVKRVAKELNHKDEKESEPCEACNSFWQAGEQCPCGYQMEV